MKKIISLILAIAVIVLSFGNSFVFLAHETDNLTEILTDTLSAESENSYYSWGDIYTPGEVHTPGDTHTPGNIQVSQNGIEYTISNGEASVTGYNSSIPENVILPSQVNGYPVTSIEYNAFKYCHTLKSVSLNYGLSIISSSAFYGCSSLECVNIPETVTNIGYMAFAFCSSLVNLSIPESVTNIGNSVFRSCHSLTSINVDTNSENFSSVNGVLFNKDKTILLYYPAGKTEKEYSIPNTVTTIGEDAFYSSKLEDISIPDSVINIEFAAFYASNLYYNEDNWENDVLYIDGHLIYYENLELESYTIKAGTKTIAYSAFYEASLKNLTIPNSVISISNNAFYYCTNLQNVIYNGSENQWKNVIIGSNNEYLLNANIIFACSCGSTDFTEWETTNDPTCTEEGIKTRKCSKCGETQTESIPVIPHKFVDGKCTVCGSDTIIIESEHNYANNTNKTWTATINGASALNVTFSSETYTESGWDYIHILDKNGAQIGTYTDSQLANKTLIVTGDTVKIQLISDGSVNEYGFKAEISPYILPEISLNQETEAEILNGGDNAFFSFTPSESGYYSFYSTSDLDTYGYVFDSDMNELKSDDDNGEDNNFKLFCYMASGKTYYLKARFYDSEETGSFNVIIKKINDYITKLEIVSLPYKTDYIKGYDSYIDYDGLVLRAIMSDASVIDWTSYDNPYIEDFPVIFDESSFEENGNVTISCGDAKITFTVNLIENPVDHIELVKGTSIKYIENTNGYINENNNFFYYAYAYQVTDAQIKIVYKNGTYVVANVDNEVDGYVVNWYHNQYGEPWVLGSNNKSTVSYLAHTVNLPITVIEDPIDHIELVKGTSIQYIENFDGYFNENGDFIYNEYIPDDAKIKIVYKDGTSTIATVDEYVDGYYVEWSTNQGEEPWVLGCNNKSTISYLGHTVNLPITVIENPVDHIELVKGTDYKYVENSEGYIEENGDFIYYTNTPYDAEIKIIYKDGTSVLARIGDTIDGETVNWGHNQFNEPWVVGTNNKSIIRYCGHTVNLPITVIENPVDHIELVKGTSIEYIENHNGESMNEDDFYYFTEYPYDAQIKIIYKNGASIIANVGDSIECNDDNYYLVSWYSNQDEEPWVLGSDNKSTISYLGHTVNLPITVIENPVESIELVSGEIVLIENMDGHVLKDYDEYGEIVSRDFIYDYDKHLQNITIKINYKDGTSKNAKVTDLVDGLYFDYYDSQYSDLWFLGEENYITVSYLGKSVKLPVEILPQTNPVTGFAITKAPNKTEYSNIFWPDFIGTEITVYYKDGTSKIFTITEDNITYSPLDYDYGVDYKIDIDGFTMIIERQYSDFTEAFINEFIFKYSLFEVSYNGINFINDKVVSYIEVENITSITGEGMILNVTYEDGTKESLLFEDVNCKQSGNYADCVAKTKNGYVNYTMNDYGDFYEINIFGNFYNYYPEESDNVTGDIDGDGKLTKNDVTIIKDAVLGDGDLTEEEKQAYDVNGDGTFNILDYINIKNIFNEMLDARSDINGDGEINAADVALMKQAVMNSSEIEDIDAYDLNGDGEINILDLIRLKKIVAEEMKNTCDVNFDGVINAEDLSILKSVLLMESYEHIYDDFSACDVNLDLKINILDLITMKKVLAETV